MQKNCGFCSGPRRHGVTLLTCILVACGGSDVSDDNAEQVSTTFEAGLEKPVATSSCDAVVPFATNTDVVVGTNSECFVDGIPLVLPGSGFPGWIGFESKKACLDRCYGANLAQVEVCKLTSSSPRAREACYARANELHAQCIRAC